MIVLKIALRNLVRNLKKNAAIGLVVAFGIGAMMFGNAVFEGTEVGIRNSFIECFTGDLAVRSEYIESFSLFGNQAPIIGGMSDIPLIAQYEEICAGLSEREEIEGAAAVVSGYMGIEIGAYQKPVCVFGVSGDEYFRFFPGIKFVEGRSLISGEPGIVLTEARVAQIAEANGKKPSIGDPIVLSMYSSLGFSLREAPLRGIARYPISNDALDSIILADANTVREVLGMRGGKVEEIDLSDSQTKLLGLDLNSLFENSEDLAAADAGLSLDEVKETMRETRDGKGPQNEETGGWTHILLRVKPDAESRKVRTSLNEGFRKSLYQVRAEDWRDTAGSSAQFVLWLRIIFNVGFIIVAIAGTFIIVNTLVILVIERTKEIGTMRALGASPGFVRNVFFLETTMLTTIFGLIGIALSLIAIRIVGYSGIELNNQFLATLFGSHVLNPRASLSGALMHALLSVCVGLTSSLYPVALALKVRPIRALAAE